MPTSKLDEDLEMLSKWTKVINEFDVAEPLSLNYWVGELIGLAGTFQRSSPVAPPPTSSLSPSNRSTRSAATSWSTVSRRRQANHRRVRGEGADTEAPEEDEPEEDVDPNRLCVGPRPRAYFGPAGNPNPEHPRHHAGG